MLFRLAGPVPLSRLMATHQAVDRYQLINGNHCTVTTQLREAPQ